MFLYPFQVEYTAAGGAGTPGEADTHAMTATGSGQTGAGEKTIGSIVLPAGGPWKIFGLWGQVVAATATAAEAVAGFIGLKSTAGDLDPNPAPVKFPVPPLGSFLGATQPVQVCPLNIWPINYDAPGKSAIDLIYTQSIAMTVAPIVAMGIIFGKTIPNARAFQFMDSVRTTVTTATQSTVGTITLAEKATRITWIGATIVQGGVITTAEELIGTFSLDSDDIKMPPADFPCAAAFGAGLGALIGNSNHIMPAMIPVNIPVAGGARIDCNIDLITAVTNGADVEIWIAYE